jgi:hypothetical protein
VIARSFGLPQSWLACALLVLPLALWALTVTIVIRRGWSDRGAVEVAAACVPPMSLAPAVSHDYKLVLLVFPLTVLAAWLVTVEPRTSARWSLLFVAVALEMVLLARSTLLTTAAVLGPLAWIPADLAANKYPLLVLLQVLMLLAFLRGPEAGARGRASLPAVV